MPDQNVTMPLSASMVESIDNDGGGNCVPFFFYQYEWGTEHSNCEAADIWRSVVSEDLLKDQDKPFLNFETKRACILSEELRGPKGEAIKVASVEDYAAHVAKPGSFVGPMEIETYCRIKQLNVVIRKQEGAYFTALSAHGNPDHPRLHVSYSCKREHPHYTLLRLLKPESEMHVAEPVEKVAKQVPRPSPVGVIGTPILSLALSLALLP